MTRKRNGTVVYALAGRALEAALRLEHELREELKTVPVKQSGNLGEINDSWNNLYEGLIARLEKEAPDVLRLTGLKAPATQVFAAPQTLPRAYREYPQIFSSPEKKPLYFMYVPVDYKGRHFAPVDSMRLNDKQTGQVDSLLFAGGWLGNAPIVSVKKQGVATPADYVPPKQSELRAAFAYRPNDRVCFLAAGRSLAAVEDYRARTKDWERKLKAACRAIEADVASRKHEILADLPAGEDVHINASYRYSSGGGDKAEILLSVRRQGKDNIWHAGKTVAAPESPAYQLSASHGGEYTVTPRRDTPEGRKIAALIDAIPLTPGLRDYPELHAHYTIEQDAIGRMLGVNGTVPQAVDVGGHTVLVYSASPKDRKNRFCPPDAKPFPTEAYEWLRADEGDRNMGIAPPPMPQAIARLLPTPATTEDDKPAKRRRGPKPG